MIGRMARSALLLSMLKSPSARYRHIALIFVEIFLRATATACGRVIISADGLGMTVISKVDPKTAIAGLTFGLARVLGHHQYVSF